MKKLILTELSPEQPLLILDLANNHNGSLAHGKQIIQELSEIPGIFDFRTAVKFQYRDLPNFIHPNFRSRRDLKYVDRFLSTMLSWDEFFELKNYAASLGFLTACTPFDEFSVQKIIEHDFDLLKIASASFTDWSLLEEVTSWVGPIVASTAGANLDEIDRVVSFLSNRLKDFALMHCVAAYPTTDNDLQLNRISRMKERYTKLPIGYSTHENPNNIIAGSLALAKGAVILERHVGSEKDGVQLNKYSSDSEALHRWLVALKQGIAMYGNANPWEKINESEQDALFGLRRFVFAKENITEGQSLDKSNIFFGIPGDRGGIQANDFGKYDKLVAKQNIASGQLITNENVVVSRVGKEVMEIRNSIIKLIDESRVTVPQNAILEISHHYGLENFSEFGTCMITVVNREYCKKLLFLLPGQTHPEMYHKLKDETFFILSGEVTLILNGKSLDLKAGDTCAIPPLATHAMSSSTGAIIEEVSSTHFGDDSFYTDHSIALNTSRKTYVKYWL